MKEYLRKLCIWLVFGFIIWTGLEAILHPEDRDAQPILAILVFIAALGSAAFVSHIWTVSEPSDKPATDGAAPPPPVV
jgi:hypothetical protein